MNKLGASHIFFAWIFVRFVAYIACSTDWLVRRRQGEI